MILASASPRRRELLDLIGIRHEVIPADIDETYLPGEQPEPHAERLAREKASVVAGKAPDAIVIGSDTIVVIDNQVLGKPTSPEDAFRMLKMLNGREHVVCTAVAVAYNNQIRSSVEKVSVTFRQLTDQDIKDYIATNEPMDKAGAYGIQGYGATIVGRVEGDYFAVMGLPLVRLVSTLRGLGLGYRFGEGVLQLV